MPVETRLQRKLKAQQAAQSQQQSSTPQAEPARRITRSMSSQMDTGSGLSPQDVLNLQGVVGNQAVSQMMGKGAPEEATDTKTETSTSGYQGKYHAGQHGYKKEEQKRLSAQHGITVSGNSHESEHTVGNEVLIRSGDMKRGQGSRARDIEYQAPAYQEVKQFHKKHIGTGSRKKEDASGFNAQSYRDSQRSLIEAGDVSSAVQLNQLGYAFNPNFKNERDSRESKASTDSYDTMVKNMDSLTFAEEEKDTSVKVDPIQKAEMLLARRAAQSGKWPTEQEIREVKASLGIKDGEEDKKI